MPDTTAATTRVLMLDDHGLFREGVARLLAAEGGFEVHHCGDIDEALAILRARPVDLVLLDLDLGARHGAEFVPLARGQGFLGKILVVAAAVDRLEASSLIQRGVSGILTKHESARKLVDGIRAVLGGSFLLDDRLLKNVESLGRRPAADAATPFTDRERAVLNYVFQGLSNKEIADRVGVSESAVKATLQQLFGKTGVRTRSQLVRIVLERYKDDI